MRVVWKLSLAPVLGSARFAAPEPHSTGIQETFHIHAPHQSLGHVIPIANEANLRTLYST